MDALTTTQEATPSQSGLHEQWATGIEQVNWAWHFNWGPDRTEPLAQYRYLSAAGMEGKANRSPWGWQMLWRLVNLRSTPECERLPTAEWPSEAAFVDALSFTEKLPTHLKEMPHISLADDGEVNFTWTRNKLHIDLGFYGTGVFSYYARDENGRELFGDDIPAKGRLPQELTALLNG